jgi:hypothetical protein
VIYTADEYIAVLNTYSGHRALEDDTRERLLTRIHRRIEARPERNVRKTYLAMLYVDERVQLSVGAPRHDCIVTDPDRVALMGTD